ncbi:MAG: glycosyl hydrolase [Thermoleophilia bacterium]
MCSRIRSAVILLFVLTIFTIAPATALSQTTNNNSGIKVGVYLPDPADLQQFESATGRKTDIFLWYSTIIEDFDAVNLAPISAGGRTLQLSLEIRDPNLSDQVNQPAYRLKNITRGDYDSRIRAWARALRSYAYPVLLRPMCEMNGNWTSWSGIANGNSPEDYIPAWRHIHDIFVAEDAVSVKWVWSPNADTSTLEAQKTFDTYYPGDGYVDYVGLNGYNWGTTTKIAGYSSAWQSLSQVFGPSYDVAASGTGKPIMISETASTELGGSKANWITDAFSTMPVRFPRIVSFTWFNVLKETDWRIESSSASLQAFRTGLGGLDPPLNGCTRPQLTIGSDKNYWANYSDYRARLLSVDMRIGNTGANGAYSLRLIDSTNTNGVSLATVLPVLVGDIAARSASTVHLRFLVSSGVMSFVTITNGSVLDRCGNSYTYPERTSIIY